MVDRLLRSLDEEEGEALDDVDRERLHAAIARSEEQLRAGQAIPSKTVLRRVDHQGEPMEDPNKPWPPRFRAGPPGSDPRTLHEIEKADWGKPTYDSYLVQTCHALRHKPLGAFSVEDLRIMIGQKISVPILVPLALERLEDNPLAAGDFFLGDLLKNVLQIDASYWHAHPEHHRRAREIANRALSEFDERARFSHSVAWREEVVEAGDVVSVVREFLHR